MKIIFDYNRTLFNPETESLYLGVLDLLKELSKRHKLYLISRFEASRLGRVKELNIEQYFQQVFFVEDKTLELFNQFVEQDEKTIVIGDRLCDEIFLGNKLGFTTIWLKQGKFASEEVKNKDEEPNFIVNDIRKINDIIKIYE